MTPINFQLELAAKKKSITQHWVKNSIIPRYNRFNEASLRSRLISEGVPQVELESTDSVILGDRGFGIDYFLKDIRNKLAQSPKSVACIGCGTGLELLSIAYILKPKRIVGYEFLNFSSAWSAVKETLRRDGIEVTFVQSNLRRPLMINDKVDFIFSNAVLEHISDLDTALRNCREILVPNGWFSAIWGPLWYCYSGDHIAAELGFKNGYDHVLLDAEEYMDWYRAHPRNIDTVARGEKTWIELGLMSYLQFTEYMYHIEKYFPQICSLSWSISSEGLEWRKRYRTIWSEMLGSNPGITPLDLLLKSVSVLAGGHQASRSSP